MNGLALGVDDAPFEESIVDGVSVLIFKGFAIAVELDMESEFGL